MPVCANCSIAYRSQHIIASGRLCATNMMKTDSLTPPEGREGSVKLNLSSGVP